MHIKRITHSGQPQMNLGELIAKLKPLAKERKPWDDSEELFVFFDFPNAFPVGLDGWRGIYAELAITHTPRTDSEVLTASQFLDMCRSALGGTFEGYKGGYYTMTEDTPLWVDDSGEYNNCALVDVITNESHNVVLITGYCEA